VVTTEHEGMRYGMTVAAFSSLSLHPPLVLICVETSVKTHDPIIASGKFGVSILRSDQADVSNRFASRVDDKFDGMAIREGELGVPLVENAITTLECRLTGHLPGGDHSIFVGEVVAMSTGEGAPLVYYRSGYRELRF
jgi:flavin reductase (DIM6/NTAB) family NADH-FMN oxidoreductase RutF